MINILDADLLIDEILKIVKNKLSRGYISL